MAEEETFAARLKRLREAAGLTQSELAERAGFNQRTISHWEQGQREPLLSNVQALAQALGVECAVLCAARVAVPTPAPRGRPRQKQDDPQN
jgi:transcriptional regulator with XRE-family HTH domain